VTNPVSPPRSPINLAFWAVLAALAVAQLALHLGHGNAVGAGLAALQLLCCLAVFGSSIRRHRRDLRTGAGRTSSPR